MKTRLNKRGGRLRAVAIAACLTMTGTAYAATTPGAQESQTGSVTISGPQGKVRYGASLSFAGRSAHGVPGRSVQLEFAPQGQGWRPAGQTTTAQSGAYRFTVRARESGSWRAVSDGGTSPSRLVRVKARIRFSATRHVHRGGAVRVRGAVRSGVPGRGIRIQLSTGHGWRTVDRARTGRGGRFRGAFRAARPGRFRLRVRFAGDRRNAGAARRLRGRVHVYRPGNASWYGPGLYGGGTACGQTLTPGTLGVANKWLPCGTRVTFRYHGRSVTVPVIDRGPYAAGREWDLTAATKRRLGFPSTGVVWSTR